MKPLTYRLLVVLIFSYLLSACSPNIDGTYGDKMTSITIEVGKFTQRTFGTEVEFDYKVDDDKIIVAVSEQANLVYLINDAGDLVGPMGMTFKKQHE
ncbi:hypothetical protein [Alteromonas sp. ASW11-130]|uniref:hypothetical protein n=1 Tax=Alteromonas sp. ASW11-130 TaxID=3015775 RepID=UPI002242B297|nr:hypothetical protein [Alteromonas sp. ASW11-130]MCW8091880.1 hypothetical protein [Alteromonas sp. ASW11-130]